MLHFSFLTVCCHMSVQEFHWVTDTFTVFIRLERGHPYTVRTFCLVLTQSLCCLRMSRLRCVSVKVGGVMDQLTWFCRLDQTSCVNPSWCFQHILISQLHIMMHQCPALMTSCPGTLLLLSHEDTLAFTLQKRRDQMCLRPPQKATVFLWCSQRCKENFIA